MSDRPLREPNHQAVLLLSTSFVAVTRLRVAIAREASLACQCAGTVGGARDALELGRPAALVLEPEDAHGEPTASLARRSRESEPQRPIIALLRRASGWTPAALALIAERPTMVAIVEDLDVSAVVRAIRPATPGAITASLLESAWPRLEASVPAELRAVVRLALAHAGTPMPVPDLARALGMHRKTLWQRCRRAGVPSPQVLFMWCRLIAASHALRTREASVERIANDLEFASPTALRNATRRYLGVTPSELREEGGEALACRAFAAWMGGMLPARGVTAGNAA